MCLALGDVHMRPFCPELIREAVLHRERGRETPGGHGEPGHTCLIIGVPISAQYMIG